MAPQSEPHPDRGRDHPSPRFLGIMKSEFDNDFDIGGGSKKGEVRMLDSMKREVLNR